MAKNSAVNSTTDWIYFLFWIIMPAVWIKSLFDNTLLPRQVYTGVFLLVIVVISFKKLFVKNRIDYGVLALFGFIVITSIASVNAFNTVESMATIARYGLVFCYLILTIDLLKQGVLNINMLIKGVISFGVLSALITLQNILSSLSSGDLFKDIYTIKGSFSHKNLLSSALMMSLPFIIMGSALFKGVWQKTSVVLIFLIVAEIFILRTRGVWVATVMASITAIACLYVVRKKNGKTLITLPFKTIGAATAVAALIVILMFSSSGVKNQFTDTSNISKRMVFWGNSMEMIKENPVLGVGAGNWKIHFPKYGLGDLDNNVKQGITHIQRPHNDYIWVLAEGGPIALILYLIVFFATFWRVRLNFKKAETREELLINVMVVAGLVAYMVFSLTDFPMERMAHNLLAMSLIALAFKNQLQSGIRYSGLIKYLVLALLFFSVTVSYYRFKGEQAALEVMDANARQDARRIVTAVEDAENSFYNMDNFANPLRYYSALGKLVQNQIDPSWQDMQIANDLHPYHILVLNLMGNNMRARDKPEEALKYYDKATEISPTFVQALISKAEIYSQRKNYVEAMRALIFINYTEQNPKYYQMLGVVVPRFVLSRGEHGRYSEMTDYIVSKNPGKPEDYIKAYKEWRKIETAERLKRDS